MMKTDVLQAALQILIPKEILDAFDLEKIEEVEGNTRIFHMVEKESQVPQVSEPLMKDGYMREVNIQHFPSGLMCSILRLKRRRWVSKKDRNKSYYNKYSFTDEEMKITREYGAFLKDAGEEPLL